MGDLRADGNGPSCNRYSHQLADEVEKLMRQLVRADRDAIRQQTLVRQCGRGMVNFQKAFSGGVIEFRAFAGTLNEKKLLHHLATVFGLARRAATVQQFGKFNRKQTKKHSKVANAVEALRRMWRLLGWVGLRAGARLARWACSARSTTSSALTGRSLGNGRQI